MVGLITIALLFVQDIHWLLVALMIRSIFIVFYYPAQQTLTRQIVSPDLLTKAVSINGIVEQGTKISRPPYRGHVVELVSTRVLPHYKSYKLFLSYLSSHTHNKI